MLPRLAVLAFFVAACPSPRAVDGGEPDSGSPDAGLVLPPMGLVDVAMRDGALLKTWVYAPAGPGPIPIFLVRNPYAQLNVDLEPYARFFTDRGIALVWQATRGTGGSQGTFVPYLNEVEDGHDTIAWLVAQPWCNGRVGVGGGSYLGYTAFAAAVDPHVVVVLSDDTAADEEMTRHDGVVNGYLLSWLSLVERQRLANATELAALTNGLDPRVADEAVLGRDLPYWNGALTASPPAVYPPAASLRTLAASICAPALHVLEGETEWNDPRLTWDAIVARGCARERDRQWLIVAPDSHAAHFSAFGLATTWVTPDMLAMLEAYLLQTAPEPTWPKVRWRVEANEPTKSSASWPPPLATPASLYLGPIGGNGEGTLTAAAPPSGAWTLSSDPAGTDPCALPTATWFTSEPLTADLVIVGAPHVVLQATTTAADFDVHVQLYDYLAASDEYRSLGSGSMRARFRTGAESAVPSGTPIALDLALPTLARRVPAGHQLTVSVAPSRCEFVENPHTAEPVDAQTQRLTAHIDLQLGPQGARLVLPLLP